MELESGFPLKVKTICSTLDQLAINSKLITKTVFRLKNLKEFEE
jgi:hypothetical protein